MARHILSYIAIALLLLLIAAGIFVQLPSVQTRAARIAIEKVRDKVDADVSLESLHFKFFNTIVLKGVCIVDRKPFREEARDTLFSAGALSVRFSLMSLLGVKPPTLKTVKISDAQFNLVLEDSDEYGTNLQRMFHMHPKPVPKPMTEVPVVSINHISAENLRYGMQNHKSKANDFPPTAIDWNDLYVHDVNLEASDFSINEGLFRVRAEHLDFKESTGFEVKHMEADATVGKGKVLIDNIILDDGMSTADLDYKMLGNTKAYSDYIDKVRMVADIRSSRWSLKTLSHFIPPLNPDPDTFVLIDGHYEGTVADMKARGLNFKVEGKELAFTLDGGVKKLPDVDHMDIDATLSGVRLSTAGVAGFVNAVAPKANLDLGDIGKGMTYRGTVSAKGDINNLDASVSLSQGKDGGSAQLRANVRNVMRSDVAPISVRGSIRTSQLDVSKAVESAPVDDLTMKTLASLTLPHGDNLLEAALDSIKIDGLLFNQHDFKRISGNALLHGTDLTVDLVSADRDLDADITVWSDKYAYNGAVNVRNADLHKLGLDKRETSSVAMNVYGYLDKDLEVLQGNASISSIYLTNQEGTVKMEDATLSAVNQDGAYDISLESEFAKAAFQGNKEHFNADFVSFDSSRLLQFIAPGMYVENGSHIVADMDKDGMIKGSIRSGRIAYNGNYVKNLTAEVSGTLDSLDAVIKADNILAAGYNFDNDVISATRRDSVIHADYTFTNAEGDFQRGDLHAAVTLGKDRRIGIGVEPSSFTMRGTIWDIPASFATIHGKDIQVNDFVMSGKDQWIRVDGRMSETAEEVLHADIYNLDISPVNSYIKGQNLGLAGRLGAKGRLFSPVGDGIPLIDMNLQVDSLQLAGEKLGMVTGTSRYDKESGLFSINLSDEIGGTDALDAYAQISPKDKTLDATATFKAFPFGFAQIFVPSVFSEMDGTLSGEIKVKGPFKDLAISSGNTRIDGGMVRVDYTNVPYYLDGRFDIDDAGIHLTGIDGHDRFGAPAHPSGSLKWNRMKDMVMDMHFDVTSLEAVNLPAIEKDKVFYGKIFATGKVDITGPFNNITLAADARTTGNSDMHIVISENMDATKGNLLTFVDPHKKPVDPYDQMLLRSSRKEGASNFSLKLHATADPTMKIGLDMGGGSLAYGLSGTGSGTVDMTVDEKGFALLGDYTLQDGTFGMNVNNIVKRNFDISNGSSIKFGGDIFESVVDLDATYETKASIATLISDTTSVSNRRVVQCGINIKDKLSNPAIGFSIDIPDLDPSVKSKVESALSTEDKVQKQFLSLLLSGNFLPDEQNGIVNNSSLLYSNVSEIMANQINNIFTRLDIPLDLGLNYQPSETGGTNLFDVALSTQLFNNRVIIGGTLGNRQDKAAASGNAFFGDLDIEYKVNRSGTFRVKAFSHSADQYSNYLDNSQRNGLGLTWQQEFDNFKTWITNLFSSRARREQARDAESQAEKKQQTIIINE